MEALTTMLTDIAGDVTGAITGVLPIAGGVLALAIGITYGLKFFKKVSGARG